MEVLLTSCSKNTDQLAGKHLETNKENKAQYVKIKSSILGIRYTYNENGKLLISGPRKAPGKYSKIKKEKFSWKICSDVLQ